MAAYKPYSTIIFDISVLSIKYLIKRKSLNEFDMYYQCFVFEI